MNQTCSELQTCRVGGGEGFGRAFDEIFEGA